MRHAKLVPAFAAALFSAGLLSAVLFSATGCSHQAAGDTGVSGTVFPAVDAGQLTITDANDVTIVSQSLFISSSSTLPQRGAFDVFLDTSGVLRFDVSGGTYQGFSTTTFPAKLTYRESLSGFFVVKRGERASNVNVSPLTDVAATMTERRGPIRGNPFAEEVGFAYDELSEYFSFGGATVRVPFTKGEALWDFSSGATTLTPEVIVGLITAGFQQTTNVSDTILVDSVTTTIQLDDYTSAVGRDAADGVVDGIVHLPSVRLVSDFVDVPNSYPSNALGDDLADAILNFLAQSNTSGLTVTAVAPFLDHLRVSDGVVTPNNPVITAIVSGPGATEVTIMGRNFAAGAEVEFTGRVIAVAVPADSITVVSAFEVRATVPASHRGLPSAGSPAIAALVTVRNQDRLVHSLAVSSLP